ncbi:MAG TPA: VOC family protein [Thermoanaerobaculia bacterium]
MKKLAAAMLMIAACRTATPPAALHAAIDHLIVGTADLEAGMAAFTAATGVTPVRGGQHPGRGTENALVSLGSGTYLELIAPQRDAAGDDPMVQALRALPKLTAVGWAVRVDDVASAREALRSRGFAVSEPAPGSRRTPSGDTLEWTAFGLSSASSDAVPFFIQWSTSTRHPSSSSPTGCTLASLELHDPAAPEISRLVDALGMNVPVQSAPRTNLIITLDCGGRRVAFTSE